MLHTGPHIAGIVLVVVSSRRPLHIRATLVWRER